MYLLLSLLARSQQCCQVMIITVRAALLRVTHAVPRKGVGAAVLVAKDVDDLEVPAERLLLEATEAGVGNAVQRTRLK